MHVGIAQSVTSRVTAALFLGHMSRVLVRSSASEKSKTLFQVGRVGSWAQLQQQIQTQERAIVQGMQTQCKIWQQQPRSAKPS